MVSWSLMGAGPCQACLCQRSLEPLTDSNAEPVPLRMDGKASEGLTTTGIRTFQDLGQPGFQGTISLTVASQLQPFLLYTVADRKRVKVTRVLIRDRETARGLL